MKKPKVRLIWACYTNETVNVDTKPGLYNPIVYEMAIMLIFEGAKRNVYLMGYNKYGTHHGSRVIIKQARQPREVYSGKIKLEPFKCSSNNSK